VFAWVAGVAGNHDSFGPDRAARPRFPKAGRLYYLDGEAAEVQGLRVAGIGGITGDPRRLQRRTEEDYLNTLDALLDRRPDVLLCHDGPEGAKHGQTGSSAMREVAELHPPTLIIRGHSHWRSPLAELKNGTQVLNVDARVVVMMRR
jgi:Icc-related predicted phosphoesterase